jgi:hypothetical protein
MSGGGGTSLDDVKGKAPKPRASAPSSPGRPPSSPGVPASRPATSAPGAPGAPGREPNSYAELIGDARRSANLPLASALHDYTALVVAMIYFIVGSIVLGVFGMLAGSIGLLTALAKLSAAGSLLASILCTYFMARAAAASEGNGKVLATVATLAAAGSLIINAYALLLVFKAAGIDEGSSLAQIDAALAAAKKLETLGTVGQVLGIAATLPFIGAIHHALTLAAAHDVAGRSGTMAGLVVGVSAGFSVIARVTAHSGTGVHLLVFLGGIAAIIFTVKAYLAYLRDAEGCLM